MPGTNLFQIATLSASTPACFLLTVYRRFVDKTLMKCLRDMKSKACAAIGQENIQRQAYNRFTKQMIRFASSKPTAR